LGGVIVWHRVWNLDWVVAMGDCMTAPYPPLRRKDRRKQEPIKQYPKELYDGSEGSEPIEVTE